LVPWERKKKWHAFNEHSSYQDAYKSPSVNCIYFKSFWFFFWESLIYISQRRAESHWKRSLMKPESGDNILSAQILMQAISAAVLIYKSKYNWKSNKCKSIPSWRNERSNPEESPVHSSACMNKPGCEVELSTVPIFLPPTSININI